MTAPLYSEDQVRELIRKCKDAVEDAHMALGHAELGLRMLYANAYLDTPEGQAIADRYREELARQFSGARRGQKEEKST